MGKIKEVYLKIFRCLLVSIIFFSAVDASAYWENKQAERKEYKKELDEFQRRFDWWPTDAKPAPIKDEKRGGYWWWPTTPGEKKPWGNRGYIYVYKVIFDYKEEELPAPRPQELRPSLLIKKIIKNVKIYFDYNKAALRDDTVKILQSAVQTLKRNPEANILVTGNCDRRGSEAYNEKLGRRRAEAVKRFMLEGGIYEGRIRIISKGKLNAVAPVTDIIGMQKDRNAQFMIAEVEEVMIPYAGSAPAPEAMPAGEGKFIIEKEEKIESEVKVSTKEYVVKKEDTLSKIAKEQLGAGHRWKYLYELNRDRIKDPNKLKAGQKIIIPVE